MSLNDNEFRQIMVGDNVAEYGDREDQHKDRQIQNGDQVVSSQATLSHGGNGQAVTRDLSASQKQLFSDVVESHMAIKKSGQISAYSKMGSDKVSHDQRGTKQYGLQRQCKKTEKGMEYRRKTLEERRGKLDSWLLWESSAIDALLYSFQNTNTVREELHLFDDQFRMILEVHDEYHQLAKDKVKQEEDEVWFDKLDENVCTFKHKLHNWLKQGEESLERESKQSSFGKKSCSSISSSKSSRSQSSNSSTKERAIAEKI